MFLFILIIKEIDILPEHRIYEYFSIINYILAFFLWSKPFGMHLKIFCFWKYLIQSYLL